MSHSKRNTSRAVFTSYERDLARKSWAATSARLHRDSFLPFSACRLCLETAVDPVACLAGDIFCRECALSNILAQKKEIKRMEKVRAQEERDEEESRALRDAEAQERAVVEFERTLSGLAPKSTSSQAARTAAASSLNSATPAQRRESEGGAKGGGGGDRDRDARAAASKTGEKRKFEIDADEIQRIAASDRAKARKAIDDEEAAKPSLPSFWVPSVMLSSKARDAAALHEVVRKKKKTGPVCPASAEDKPHAYSLHSLVSIRFTTESRGDGDGDGGSTNGNGSGSGSGGKEVRICPSCKKALGNSSRAMLAKPCGHVLCGSCVDKFMKPDSKLHHHHHDPHATEPEDVLRCYVCDADLTDRGQDEEEGDHRDGKKEKKKDKDKEKIKPGLVELRSEGTGYSAGGTNQVRKTGGAAFQC
ncbi:ENOS interacting protein [Xylaria arbuscula]|nr:ENOS interacting protein [Xylaria arbuscula]